MRYIGLDVHQHSTAVCVLGATGKKEREWNIKAGWNTVITEIQKIKGPKQICYEATSGYDYLYKALRSHCESIKVAHPGHLRLIFRSKKKNDRVDAQKLAKLLFLQEVPEIFVPPQEYSEWRSGIRLRNKQVQAVVRVKNRIRCFLKARGLCVPEEIKSLWTKKGLAWLSTFCTADGSAFSSAMEMEILLEELTANQVRLKRLTKMLDQRLDQDPRSVILKSVPGIGNRTAEALLAWIVHPHRFSQSSIGSYFGLVPSQDASGGVNRLGRITKTGSPIVRKLLMEACWQALYRSPSIRAYYEKIRKGDPCRNKIAIVATAHHLLKICLGLLKKNEAFEEKYGKK